MPFRDRNILYDFPRTFLGLHLKSASGRPHGEGVIGGFCTGKDCDTITVYIINLPLAAHNGPFQRYKSTI